MLAMTGFLISISGLTVLAVFLFAVGLGFIFHAFAAGANEQGRVRWLAIMFAIAGLGAALSSLYAVVACWWRFFMQSEAALPWASLWLFAYPAAFLLGGLLLLAVPQVVHRSGR